jgi:thioredoxin reductase (NADPH)
VSIAVFDYDVVIIGGGPAGLTAGRRLSEAGRRTLLLERELFGGNLENVDEIEGTTGAQLAAELSERAAAAGLRMEEAEATSVEAFSSTRWVGCDGGRGYSAGVVIVAAGTRFRRLGLPGEEALRGRGVIDCVPCDAGFFAGRAVAVCGSDDHALAEALYLARLASRVTVLTRSRELLARGEARERVLADSRIEVRCGTSVDAILGSEQVEGLAITDVASGRRETLGVEGVVLRVGSEPNTELLDDVVDLDATGYVLTNDALETSAPHLLAAGDVRSGSPARYAAAVRDGLAAARRAEELLAASR